MPQHDFRSTWKLSADGKLVVGGQREWGVFDTQTGRPLPGLPHRLEARGRVFSAFSPDGTLFAMGLPPNRDRPNDNNLMVWQIQSGELWGVAKQPKRPTYLAFSPDNKILAACGPWKDSKKRFDFLTGQWRDTVTFWSVSDRKEPTGAPLKSFRTIEFPESIEQLQFSPDGRMLAVGCLDSQIRITDLESGKVTADLPGRAVAFSPDGRMLVTGASDAEPTSVKLWDVASWQLLYTLESGHIRPACSFAFSPDGKLLASGGHGGIVTVWDTTTGKAIWEPLFPKSDSK